MKKYIILSTILCLGNMTYAMQDGPWFQCTVPRNDGTFPDDVYLDSKFKIKETYDNYFYSLAETASEDDTLPHMMVRPAIFAQLCVQASKAHNLDKQPFQELVNKIKAGIIDKDADMVTMTNKDGKHRLLSYIPQGQIHSLVNNKKVEIMFIVKMASIGSEAPPKFQVDKSFCGKRLKPTGEEEIVVGRDYTFQSDINHHIAVLTEFQKLITQ